VIASAVDPSASSVTPWNAICLRLRFDVFTGGRIVDCFTVLSN
jgi:hypothetical protein